ncbi:MAG TPA: AbrB/MazE/SpoVT family DNA-binding domain-containing protein [Candidatus Acidoferrales bacterium]|nr:AbrB/MazE/SpoVT family DNA-binding domain-containing protein [Candidatus Acidoferrales bacterium]
MTKRGTERTAKQRSTSPPVDTGGNVVIRAMTVFRSRGKAKDSGLAMTIPKAVVELTGLEAGDTVLVKAHRTEKWIKVTKADG